MGSLRCLPDLLANFTRRRKEEYRERNGTTGDGEETEDEQEGVIGIHHA